MRIRTLTVSKHRILTNSAAENSLTSTLAANNNVAGGYVPELTQASCFDAFVEILLVDVLPESGGL